MLAQWFVAVASLYGGVEQAIAEPRSVSIIFVRHAEADTSLPGQPLSGIGRHRVELLAPSLQNVKFTHVFATHTMRARQTVEGIATAHGLPVAQLPAPGSLLDGQPVDEATPRAAAIEPLAAALKGLPPGSVALVALNSENFFAILNRLGVAVAAAGKSCSPGSMCVPCADNSCFPRDQYDQLWHMVREPGRNRPQALIELRYGAGWRIARS